MSYTNDTTHYGIPLPLGTDKTTPMDYNESMQEVDTVLFGAKSDSDSALRKAQQVEEGLSQTNEDVSGLEGRVTTLEGTSVTHGNAIQQNAQDIADVRADALDMIEAKDEGTAQVATVAVSAGEYFRYNDVLYKATQNIDVGNTIVPNTNCRATNVGTELTNLNNELSDISDDLTEVTSALNGKILIVTVAASWNSQARGYNESEIIAALNNGYKLINVVNNYGVSETVVYGMSYMLINGFRVPTDKDEIIVVADKAYDSVVRLDFIFVKE